MISSKIIKKQHLQLVFLLIISAISLFGCSSKTANYATSDEEGIEGTGIVDRYTHGDPDEEGMEGTGVMQSKTRISSTGTITGFGSIYVNGIKFETDTADIVINDYDGHSEDQLKLGMVVNIEGYIDPDGSTTVATKVIYDRIIAGEISAVSMANETTKTITILGQSIEIGPSIVFENCDYQSLNVNQDLEISGYIVGPNRFLATRVQIRETNVPSSSAMEVEAQISSIDTVNKILQLGTLLVDYSESNLDGDVEGQLREGGIVEVNANGFNASGELVAQQITIQQDHLIPQSTGIVSLEGIIDQVSDQTIILATGQQIDISNANWASEISDELSAGNHIIIEGTINGGDLIQADTLNVVLPSISEISGIITQVDAENGHLYVDGEVVVVDLFATFEDQSIQENRYFNLEDINVGDMLEIFISEEDDLPKVNSVTRTTISFSESSDEGIELNESDSSNSTVEAENLGATLESEKGTSELSVTPQPEPNIADQDASTIEVTVPNQLQSSIDLIIENVTSGTLDNLIPEVSQPQSTPVPIVENVTSGAPDNLIPEVSQPQPTPDPIVENATSGAPDNLIPEVSQPQPTPDPIVENATSGAPDNLIPEVSQPQPTPDPIVENATSGAPDNLIPEVSQPQPTPDPIVENATSGAPDNLIPEVIRPQPTSDPIVENVTSGAPDNLIKRNI